MLIQADSWSVSNSSGRASVRIESQKTWNEGIFAIDLDHMPTGCGTWPAFWMVASYWQNKSNVYSVVVIGQITAKWILLKE